MKPDFENGAMKTGASAPAPRRRRRPAFSLQPSAFSLAPARRAGFTLIELLIVMVVIAVLTTIIMGSAGFLTRLSRARRAEVSCRVLETALARYRSDYDKWPLGTLTPSSSFIVKASGKDNRIVFGALRESSDEDNPRRIRYLDESTFYTVDDKDQPVPLDRQPSGKQPLIYVTREGARVKYFYVEINVDTDTVKVSAPELNN